MLCEIAKEHNLTIDVTATCSWPISLPQEYAFTNYDASEKNLYDGDTAVLTKDTVESPVLYSGSKNRLQ